MSLIVVHSIVQISKTIGQMTNVEVDLARFFGLTLLCNGLIWLITRETRDGTIVIAVLQSRAFVLVSIMLIKILYYKLEVYF